MDDLHDQANHAWWEERARLHPDTGMYQEYVTKLRSGGDPLNEIELREVGDVQGKDLLHLQCHIGTDSLGWVRRGAAVTGVDFSQTALDRARALSSELGLPARFLLSRVETLPAELDGKFDVVFTSYGAISWLRDLRPWAHGIARVLRPGGFFYIVDAHPMLGALEQRSGDSEDSLVLSHPYFEREEPVHWESSGSYADPDLPTSANSTREWSHGLGEVMARILDVGLTIELVGEHQCAPWRALPICERGTDGNWRLPESLRERLPLLFSLRARRPSR